MQYPRGKTPFTKSHGQRRTEQTWINIDPTTTEKGKQNIIEQNITKWIFKKYTNLCTRLGRSKNHIAKSIMKKDKTPSQHKGRRVPLHLIEKVEHELQKLIEDNQIICLDKCPDDLFISPVAITVKKDKSIKIALDSKELNKAIHKNKYQMQSIDHLTDSLAMHIASNKNKEGPWWFSNIDLKYAYSQIPLDSSISEHCNFNIIGGKATGTYRFINGFYGLTDMPATFQKTIDKTLEGCKNYFAYLDDILIATKGKLKEHEDSLETILHKLNKEGLAISLHKCEFAKPSIDWLGFKITQNGVTPLITKTEALLKLDEPRTLKQLRSFMGSIHHLLKFIPHLAKLSEPLRPLLKKENTTSANKLKWEDKHTNTFNTIKSHIAKIVENKHFDDTKDTRVKCDASKLGLGATLEQKTDNVWHTIAFASRFLNTIEQRYTTNELELLAVVWSLEHFKHYLQGSEFTLQTDHQALLTALKENRGNKTYQSRLTRWVDRLLPFNFDIEHIPGKQMGFADYFSLNPNGMATPPSEEDKHFVINQINDFKFTLIKNTLRNNQCKAIYKLNNYDVMNHSKHKQTNTRAFCHYRHTIQSPPSKTSNFKTRKAKIVNSQIKPKEHIQNPLSIFTNNSTNNSKNQFINVVTRNRPHIETSDRTVIRRHRGPNKKKLATQKMENNTTRPPLVTIGKQTEDANNYGKGREPVQPDLHAQIFPLSSNYERMPNYRKQLTRVFGEEFLAEATKQDRSLTPIIKMINDKDWESLKKTNNYFYSL